MATKSCIRLGGYCISANREPVRIYTQYAEGDYPFEDSSGERYDRFGHHQNTHDVNTDENLRLRLVTELVKKESK